MLNTKDLDRITLRTAIKALRWLAENDPKSIKPFLDGAYASDDYMYFEPAEGWK